MVTWGKPPVFTRRWTVLTDTPSCLAVSLNVHRSVSDIYVNPCRNIDCSIGRNSIEILLNFMFGVLTRMKTNLLTILLITAIALGENKFPISQSFSLQNSEICAFRERCSFKLKIKSPLNVDSTGCLVNTVKLKLIACMEIDRMAKRVRKPFIL